MQIHSTSGSSFITCSDVRNQLEQAQGNLKAICSHTEICANNENFYTELNGSNKTSEIPTVSLLELQIIATFDVFVSLCLESVLCHITTSAVTVLWKNETRPKLYFRMCKRRNKFVVFLRFPTKRTTFNIGNCLQINPIIKSNWKKYHSRELALILTSMQTTFFFFGIFPPPTTISFVHSR